MVTRDAFVCLYCNQPKSDADSSLEHIFPQSLGGELLSENFKTRSVCKQCNNLLGLYVDGAFIKSSLSKSSQALDAFAYMDIENGYPVPLIYMGKLTGLNLSQDEVCELWIAPCRSTILHIHKNIDEEFFDFAGGDPRTRGTVTGTAIFINSSTSEKWLRLGLTSFTKHFKNTERQLANVVFEDEKHYESIGSKPSDRTLQLFQQYEQLAKKPLKLTYSVDLGFCERFASKIALGIGLNFLGDEFINSKEARNLRSYLWEKDFAKRQEIPVQINAELGSGTDDFLSFFRWEGGIVIALLPTEIGLNLHMNIFGRSISIIISNDTKLIEKQSPSLGWGRFFILIPQAKKCIELDFNEYVLHSSGAIISAPLKELENLRLESDQIVKLREADNSLLD